VRATGIGVLGAFVAVLMGVTVLSSKFAAYAVLSSGVIATANGNPPTEIEEPGALVAVSIGVTESLCVLAT